MKILMKTNIPIISDVLTNIKGLISGTSAQKSGNGEQRISGDDKKKANTNLDAIILRRQQGAVIKSGYISLFLRILVIVIIAWMLFSHMFLLTQVHGNGMFPSMKDGDLVIGFRLQDPYIKGDVVVYRHNGELNIGRIAARAGDVINIGTNGTVLVNGTTQTGEIMYPTYAKEGIEYPYTVPDGHVFIMGDYRTQSEDSRDFGSVSLEDIEAKVITILRRRTL